MAKVIALAGALLVKKVTMEFTPAEAETIYDILTDVGGDAVTTRRGHAEAIMAAFRAVDPDHFRFGIKTKDDIRVVKDGIQFFDPSQKFVVEVQDIQHRWIRSVIVDGVFDTFADAQGAIDRARNATVISSVRGYRVVPKN